MKEDLSSLIGEFSPERTLILMKTDYSKLNEKILELAEKFGENGVFLANHKSKTVLSTVYGKNLSTKEPIKAESRYLLPLCCSSMLVLCAFILIDEGKLRLSDKISKFVPEFEHAEKITVRNLLAGKSGIRDFYFGEIRRTLDEDSEYSSLSDIDRRKKDMELFLHDYTFETVLNSIKGKELEHEPGVSGDFSSSSTVFLREIIERVSGVSIKDFIKHNIFEKLGMKNTEIGISENALPLHTLFRNEKYIEFKTENTDYPFFTADVSDLEKLMLGIFEHRLFSEKLWKTANRFDSDNLGLGFEGLDGFSILAFDFNEFSSAVFYFDKENDFCWLRAANCGSKYIQEDDSKILFFPKEVRMELSPLFTFPKNTKMVPYGSRNWRQATALEIRPDQREFVSGALDTIAYSAAYKNHKLFVEMEGEKAVGLLDLSVDKKKGDYNIEIVLIDRRYQGRGFGKFMLRFAVDYLKKAGAKKLSIGVNRFNIPAQKLYRSVGFKEDCVYEEGIWMTQVLSEE